MTTILITRIPGKTKIIDAKTETTVQNLINSSGLKTYPDDKIIGFKNTQTPGKLLALCDETKNLEIIALYAGTFIA